MFDSKHSDGALTLEFEDPTKLKDGKYYSKASNKYLVRLHSLQVLGAIGANVPLEILDNEAFVVWTVLKGKKNQLKTVKLSFKNT